jgi:hypothetical protein
MRPRSPLLAAASSLFILAAALRSAGQAPVVPPDVQAIIARMQQGQLPTAAEQARLREWSQQMKGALPAPGGPATTAPPALPPSGTPPPGDSPPTPADSPAPASIPAGPSSQPPAANPPGSSQSADAADVELKGRLTLAITQKTTSDKGAMTYQGTVSLPALYRLHDDGKQLNLGFSPDLARSYQVRFTGRGYNTHDGGTDCPTHQDKISQRLSTSGRLRDRRISATGELVAPGAGSTRADVQLLTLAKGPITDACPCGRVTRPAPIGLSPLTVDGLRGNVPFRYRTGALSRVPAGLDLMSKLTPSMRAAVEGATLDFDAAELRAARARGGRYQKTVTYHYVIHDSSVHEVTTRLAIDIQFVNGRIQVNPDPPQRAEDVTLTANVEGATKFRWTITPGPCPQTGYTVAASPGTWKRDGRTQTFKALCDFHVELHSESDDGNASDDDRYVSVTRRDGFDINFADDAKPMNEGKGALTYFNRKLGMNRCVEQTDPVIDNDHDGWIHSVHDSQPADFSPDLTVKKLEGDGPFAGLGYIVKHTLKIARQPILNKELFHGVFSKLNIDSKNQKNLTALQNAVLMHEHTHTDLAHAWVDDNDPAGILEEFVIDSDEQNQANALVRSIDNEIEKASSESAVAAELETSVGGEELVCFPDRTGLQDCGPLADEGTPKAPACHDAGGPQADTIHCLSLEGGSKAAK